ncbi:MAG TPA: ABC transporter ATP-binding protein [Candidatus Acidoferrum sp.]|nr:ABC transporter ATP-binding protein [Candidatus Acidoferrum sp.]
MKSIWRVFRFASSLWRYYVVIGFLTIIVSVIAQLQPIFIKGAVDQASKVLTGGAVDITLVVIFGVLIFVTDVGQTLLDNLNGYLGDLLAVRLKSLMAERYYTHLLGLPQSYFDTELTGRIINRMNRGIGQITDFVQMMSNNFLQFIFGTVFSLAIVAYYSWQTALMLLLLYPIFVGLTAKSSNKWQNYQNIINEESDVAGGRFAEAVGQVKVVKSFAQELRELSFFGQRMQRQIEVTKPQSRYWHSRDIVRRLVLNIIFLGVFVFIFVETARGSYSLGTMVLLIQYAMMVRIPIFSISYLVDQTQRTISNTKDYFEVMDIAPEIADHAGAKKLAITKGEVQFKDVQFAYDTVPVLQGLSLTLEPDSKVALVGESGEGKTTITSLLLRLYEVKTGAITVDGQNINDVTQGSLREKIGVVFQDPALFSGTIRENISYAKPGATQDQITAAARAANAHEFIEKLEKGYDTEIGERGLKLSGGQKQRIAIARALLKDAPILILDEATSSLDSRSEHMVQEALERLMKHRTTLIIAHRLSTIQTVDKIITLRGGRVDESGSPAQLARSGGIYAQLLKLQQSKTETAKKKLKEYEIAS